MSKRRSATDVLRMQEAMRKRPMTVPALAVLTGLSIRSVRKFLNDLPEGSIYEADWHDDVRGRKFVAAYRWGNKPGVPRPGDRRSEAQRAREYRARKKGGV